jgi:hypothetical protein
MRSSRHFRLAGLWLFALALALATRARADTPPYPQPPSTGGATVLTDTPAGGQPVLSWSPGGGGGGGITALTQDVTASGTGSVPATVVAAQAGEIVFGSGGALACGAESVTPGPNGHGWTLGNVGPSGNYTGVYFGYSASATSPPFSCLTPNNYQLAGDINGNTQVNLPSLAGNLFFNAQNTAIADYSRNSGPYLWEFGESTASLNVVMGHRGIAASERGGASEMPWMDTSSPPTCSGVANNGILSAQAGALHWCDEHGNDFVITGQSGGTNSFVAYVGKGGNDTTGNGSLNAPWLTLSHALATISGASSSQPWVVSAGPGTYSESLAFVPFVFVSCVDPSTSACVLGGNLSLASSFSATGAVAGLSNFTVTGTTTIDYSAVSQSAGEVIFFNDMLGGAVSATGSGASNDDFVDEYQSENLSTTTATGLGLYTVGTVFLAATSIAGSTLGAEWTSQGDAFSPSFAVSTGSTSTVGVLMLGTFVQQLSLSGTGIAYDASVEGIPPSVSVSSGASLANITYSTAANGLGYTPTTSGNWHAVPSTAQAGLDNLAALFPNLATPPTTGSAVVLTDTPSGGSAVLSWAAAGGGGTITLTGDTTGSGTTTIATTTAKVNGTSYPAGGALTTGNACYVTGAAACAYSPLNLASAGFVGTSVLGVANGGTSLSSAPISGNTVLTDSAGTISWNPVPTDVVQSGTTTQGTTNTLTKSIAIPANESWVCSVKWTGIVSTAGTVGSVGDTIAATYTSGGANSSGLFGSAGTQTVLNNGTASFTGTTFSQSFSGSNLTSTANVTTAGGGAGMVTKWTNEFSCVFAGP